MAINFHHHFRRSPLANRLIRLLLLLALLATGVITGLQAVFEYRFQSDRMQSQLENVEVQSLAAITRSVWATHEQEARLQMRGITTLGFIDHIMIRNDDGVWLEVGEFPQTSAVTRTFQLQHEQLGKVYDLGTLSVSANTAKIWDEVWQQFSIMLTANALIIFTIVGIVFVLFDRLVTRHLVDIADYVHDLDAVHEMVPLRLQRLTPVHKDELDELTGAINQMQTRSHLLLAGLRASEARMRSIIDASPVPFALYDDKGVITYINPEFERTFGYTLEDVTKLEVFWQLMLPDAEYRRHVLDVWQQRMILDQNTAKKIHSIQIQISCKNGTQKTLIAGDVALESASDKLHLISLYDISDLIEADKARRQSEALLKQTQAMAHLGSWSLEFGTDVVKWSEEVYRIFDKEPGHFTPSYENYLQCVHPDDRQNTDQVFRRAVDEGRPYNIDHRILTANDRIRWVHAEAIIQYDDDNQPISIQGFVQDVTERKQALHALVESEQRFRAIADYTYDCETWLNPDGTLRWINPAVERLAGYTVNECMAMSDFPLPAIAEQDRDMARDLFHSIIQNRTSGNDFTMRLTHKNGRDIWIAMSWVPIYGYDGQYLGVRFSARDITERKQADAEFLKLQMQLLQAQKMEAIGHLAGGIAHDFNNMLGVMIGYAGILQAINDKSGYDSDKIEKYLSEILTAGARAKELISQMLIFSRTDHDMHEQEAPVVLLKPVVKEVVNLLHSSIPANIQLNYWVDDEQLQASIMPVQLHQILLNLGINARDAIEEFGKIEIVLRKQIVSGVCASCHQNYQGEYIILSVRDTGKGIPPKMLDRVFDPFFTTKEVGKGTGMGLSVVHGIVHGADGHVTIESDPASGTSVGILLPMATARAGSDPEAQESLASVGRVAALSGLRIMVVDDEMAICNMLQELLSLQGAQVKTFVHPAGALEAFEAQPDQFDVVITDETMPELSGIELSRCLLARRPGLPIILCTGYSEQVDEEVARVNHIAGFMRKPLVIAELIHMIQNVVAGTDDNKGLRHARKQQ